MFVKALTLPGITLPETVNIQFSMNKFEFDFLESMEFRCHFNFCVGQGSRGFITGLKTGNKKEITPCHYRSYLLVSIAGSFHTYDLVINSTKSQVHNGLILDTKKETTTCQIRSYLLVSIAGAGFEPATSGLWARRATRLLYPAIIYYYISKYLSFIKNTKTNLQIFSYSPSNFFYLSILIFNRRPATEQSVTVISRHNMKM